MWVRNLCSFLCQINTFEKVLVPKRFLDFYPKNKKPKPIIVTITMIFVLSLIFTLLPIYTAAVFSVTVQ